MEMYWGIQMYGDVQMYELSVQIYRAYRHVGGCIGHTDLLGMYREHIDVWGVQMYGAVQMYRAYRCMGHV